MRTENSRRRSARREGWFIRIAIVIMMAGVFLALGSPLVWAIAGGEEGHQEASHTVHFGKDMIFQIVNFFLLVCLLLYVYRKYSSGSFEKRSLEIQMAMEEAARAKKAAEDKYLEYQTRVAQLDEEIAEILELSKGDAQRERTAIIEEAKKQSEKIVEQARLTAKHEVVLAKQALREEAAELAAQMAADAIQKATTPEDQRKWVQAYIDKIGEVQ